MPGADKATRLRLLVALPSEARPLNALLGLSRDRHELQQRIYRGGGHLLLVSGIGRQAMLAGAEWLLEEPDSRQALWLNIGIAGHPHREIGEGVLVNKVHHGGVSLMIELPADPPCPCDPLITVDTPCTDYPEQALYDMEGWDFFRFLQENRLRGLGFKIVSDNLHHPVERLDADLVSELFTGQLETIRQVIDWAQDR